MGKLLSNEKLRFFTKVIAAHTITYIVCGMVAYSLFNYGAYTESLGFRPMEEINFGAVLIGQIVRGILFGLVIWWIRDSIVGKKLGWLKLWSILVILGIFTTYGPNMGSIEGMIYLDLSSYKDVPISGLLSLLEITMQPLLFSVIVTFQRKKKYEPGEGLCIAV